MKSPRQLAEEAIFVEQNCLNESVGVQDQIMAAHGGLRVIELGKDKNWNIKNEEGIIISSTSAKTPIEHKKLSNLNKESIEKIINDLININKTNFKGVGQPLRIALTGSKFGPGIYDIIISLGKEEVQKRLRNKILS